MYFHLIVRRREVQLFLLRLGTIGSLVTAILLHSFRGESEKLQPVAPPAVVNDPVCGIASEEKLWPDEPIFDGGAGFGTFPWQVSIGVGQDTVNCGGVIINQWHVLTAASCVANASPRETAVRVGDYFIILDREPQTYKSFYVRPAKIIVHPLYNVSSGRQPDQYNVAVLKLARKLHYQPHIRPICLPESGTSFAGSMAWNIGWGDTHPFKERNHRFTEFRSERRFCMVLKSVQMPVVNNEHCREWDHGEGKYNYLSDEMLCAGMVSSGIKRQCQGDRGGPLMIQKDERWYVIGILADRFACSYIPGTYHRVSSTSEWISSVAQILDDENEVAL